MENSILSQFNGWWQFLVGIGASGGAVVTWLATRRASRAKQRDDELKVRAEIMAIRSLLSVGFNIPVDKLTIAAVRDILTLSNQTVEEIKSFIKTTPPPHVIWLKKRVGKNKYVMVQCSDHFADIFLGRPADFYEGKADDEIWPADLAKAFGEGDEKAYIDGSHYEDIEIYSPLTGARGNIKDIKWPYSVGQDHYIAGLGTFIPTPIGEKLPSE